MKYRTGNARFALRATWLSLSLLLICGIVTIQALPSGILLTNGTPGHTATADDQAADEDPQRQLSRPPSLPRGSGQPAQVAAQQPAATGDQPQPHPYSERTDAVSAESRPRVFIASSNSSPPTRSASASTAQPRQDDAHTRRTAAHPVARPNARQQLVTLDPPSADGAISPGTGSRSFAADVDERLSSDTSSHNSSRTPLGPAGANSSAARDQQLELSLLTLQRQMDALTTKVDLARTQPVSRSQFSGEESRIEFMLERMQDRIFEMAQNQSLQTIQQQQLEQLKQLQTELQQLRGNQNSEQESGPSAFPLPPSAPPATNVESPPVREPDSEDQPQAAQPDDMGITYEASASGGGVTLTFQQTPIHNVLDLFAQLSGRNIVIGKGVTGSISATLKNVSIDEALEAVLRMNGLVSEVDGKFIYVSTSEGAETSRRSRQTLETRVFRPKYISAGDLQTLLTPFITPTTGKIAITTAAEAGIELDSTNAGGDKLIQEDAVLVQDYPDVVAQIENIIVELDRPPMQVVIEAMILSVQLTDDFKFGVNFALLNDTSKSLALNGNGQLLNSTVGFPPQGGGSGSIVPPAGEFLANTAGLKYGMIAGDISMFVDALESVTDTNLVASPQLRVINKQKAELIIGNRLGYRTVTNNGTTSIESANFMDVGTKLVLRPFITSDGLVRMEIHPERSSGTINSATGLPDTQTTEVTTNIMIRDGSTVVIGGLIEEQVTESIKRVPLLGSLPMVGPVFQNTTERIDRTELIVLITPRIVRDTEAEDDARIHLYENRTRNEHFKNELSPANRTNLARLHYERAQYYLQENELGRARFHAREAARITKNSRASVMLLEHIEQRSQPNERRWWQFWKRRETAETPVVETMMIPMDQPQSTLMLPLPELEPVSSETSEPNRLAPTPPPPAPAVP